MPHLHPATVVHSPIPVCWILYLDETGVAEDLARITVLIAKNTTKTDKSLALGLGMPSNRCLLVNAEIASQTGNIMVF